MGEMARAKVEAEIAAEAAERSALEAKAGRSDAFNDQAAAATAEAHRRIDQLARTKTERPGDRGIR